MWIYDALACLAETKGGKTIECGHPSDLSGRTVMVMMLPSILLFRLIRPTLRGALSLPAHTLRARDIQREIKNASWSNDASADDSLSGDSTRGSGSQSHWRHVIHSDDGGKLHGLAPLTGSMSS